MSEIFTVSKKCYKKLKNAKNKNRYLFLNLKTCIYTSTLKLIESLINEYWVTNILKSD